MTRIQMLSGPNRGTSSPEASRRDSSRTSAEVGGSIASIRGEVDDCFADIRTFAEREPDEVMRMVSGWSARMSELKVRTRRVEDLQREWKAIREREIEPTLDELAQQYVIASRLLTVRELDYKMAMGQP